MSWAFALLVSVSAVAEEGAVFARAGLNLQDGATYRGRTAMLATGYRRPRAYTLGLNADLTERRYAGDVRVVDRQVYLNGSRALSEYAYVDGSLGHGDTLNIYARYAAAVMPHFVVDRHDLGVGVRFAEYRTGQTGTLTAAYLRYFTNGLTLGATSNLVRAESSLASFAANVIYQPIDSHVVRATAAAGRTLEDRGLEARFNSLALEYAYAHAAGWMIGLGYVDYWSQVRRERVIGLRAGWR